MHTCKNCSNAYNGNFCPNCGQDSSVERIDKNFILSDLILGVFKYKKGYYYTLKSLLMQPGVTTRNFLKGKRAGLTSPIPLMAFLLIVYGFFESKVDYTDNPDPYLDVIGHIFQYLANHQMIMNVLLLPLSAFTTYLLFKKQNYNFYEIIVLEAFTQAVLVFVSIILLPLDHFYKSEGIYPILIFTIFFLAKLRFKYYFFQNVKGYMVFLYLALSTIINLIAIIALVAICAVIYVQITKCM